VSKPILSASTYQSTGQLSESAECGESTVRLSTAEIRRLSLPDALEDELAVPAEYVLARTGKQVRARIVLESAQSGPNPDGPAVRVGAAAIELFHVVTLIHDDVVDDGQLRRGADAVGTVYGHLASAFCGGALFARASELIATCGDEPTKWFAEMASEACDGQMREFADLFDNRRSIPRYQRAIAGKTASVFKMAGWLGSWLAGAPAHTAEALAGFGYEFGMAFQMADDILDLTAGEKEIGKPRGKDLQQGVYTSAVIHALQVDRDLARMLDRDGSEGDCDELVARIAAAGGIENARRECEAWTERARASLDAIGDADDGNRVGLTQLVDEVLMPVARGAPSG
jgi:heptaprenyl diphosphate synthase